MMQFEARLDSVNCPGRMLGDEGLGIDRGPFKRREVFGSSDISQSDADIA